MNRFLWCMAIFLNLPILSSFKLGLENISDSLIAHMSKKNVGLVINQTSVDQSGKSSIDILREKGVNLVALFAPEHGIRGDKEAAQHVEDGKDVKTQLPIRSLYGHGTGRKIDEAMIRDIDLFIFDIQDSGMRHYTYISTLYRLLEAAAHYNKSVLVLDRPNPLGARMEGTLVDPHLISFISIAPIPVRHAMTMGELALYFNQHVLEKKAKLHVVPMSCYARNMSFPPSVSLNLSPNIQNIESCYGYSFLGLLGEIKPFDVCVGTEKAFQGILLPDSSAVSKAQWNELADALKKLGIASSSYAYFNERKKQNYKGLQLKINDINKTQSYNALLAVIHFSKDIGIKLNCSKEFDKAAGTLHLRNFIEGTAPLTKLTATIESDMTNFLAKARDVLIYSPLPHNDATNDC